jgi:hypothetical protein
MTEPFVNTETDKTKSKWLQKLYQDFVREFGRPQTTQRALFYYALQRKDSDYPICGGFVGEIRITRPYHESDGQKLPKWMSKAKKMGFVPAEAILDEIAGENARETIFVPEVPRDRSYSIEVWLNNSALGPLLYSVCQKYGATLVTASIKPSHDAIKSLYARCHNPTIILCLSDLRPYSAFFCSDLAREIAESRPSAADYDIRLKCIGLKPQQVMDLKIPLVPGSSGSKKDQNRFKRYLKSHGIDSGKTAELDALEVYYPGGIAGFLDKCISKYACNFDADIGAENESWLLDLKKGIFPKD